MLKYQSLLNVAIDIFLNVYIFCVFVFSEL